MCSPRIHELWQTVISQQVYLHFMVDLATLLSSTCQSMKPFKTHYNYTVTLSTRWFVVFDCCIAAHQNNSDYQGQQSTTSNCFWTSNKNTANLKTSITSSTLTCNQNDIYKLANLHKSTAAGVVTICCEYLSGDIDTFIYKRRINTTTD